MQTSEQIRKSIVGKFVKKKRESANKTQWDVAHALDYTTAQFVSNWERGVSLPPVDQVPKIARFFGCKPAEIYDRLEMCELKEVEEKYKVARKYK